MTIKEREMDLQDNKSAYEKKMGREIKEIAGKVNELEKTAKKRGAEENSEVRRALQDVQMKLTSLQKKFDTVKHEAGESWPEGSRDVSGAYKELQDLVESLETRVKPK